MLGGASSIQIARLFGIRIGASWSWFVVFGVLIFVLSDYFQTVIEGGSPTEAYVVAVLAALLFFASIVLHELGHALVARRLGIAISGIDLWFFGGIAKMSRDTDSPGAEFKVAAAGPAVTLVIAAVCAGLNLALSTDLRIVSKQARLLAGFLRIGLHPGGGFFTIASRTAGREATAAMGLFSEEIDGVRAEQIGLAWRAVEDDEVESLAIELATRTAKDPELAREAVRSFRTEAGPPSIGWEAALHFERATQMWSQRRRNRS